MAIRHQAHYNRDDDAELAPTILFAVAEAKSVDPLDSTLPPLYDSLDTAALESTFFGPPEMGRPHDEEGVVTFTYVDVKVTVQSDGWIFVHEPIQR